MITDDAELLAPSAVEGSPPRLGIVVSIEEAYTQCSKALIRSDLWNPERHIDRSELPSAGEILRSLNDPSFDAESTTASGPSATPVAKASTNVKLPGWTSSASGSSSPT